MKRSGWFGIEMALVSAELNVPHAQVDSILRNLKFREKAGLCLC